jgi:glucokinase
MFDTIRSALKDGDVNIDRLAGIGVGCPGPLDLDKGILRKAPNLGWENVPLKAQLEKAFSCPAIIANDVDVGVYGEYCFGAARGAYCAVGVFPGTGIGGGCVYRGEILRGKVGSCMELGHLRVAPEGPRCGCGQRGCLEAVASRLAISGAAVQAVFRGEAPALAESCGTDLSNIRSKALARSIAAGDIAIERIIRDAARTIGTALASVIALLSPDRVVLGGGLVEAMPDLFVSEVTEAARAAVLAPFRDTFDVRVAELGDDAGVRGAAALAKRAADKAKA